MKYDILIVGGGPIGLSFACSFLDSNLKILLIEKSNIDLLKNPKNDGREVAITHSSLKILKKIKVWDLIDKNDISALNKAKVFDGNSSSLLDFQANDSIKSLGYLVPNFQIKKAFYQRLSNAKNIDILTDTLVNDIDAKTNHSEVTLSNKDKVKVDLVVAADSRFSAMRSKMGISSFMEDFAKTMIVTKMEHKLSHQNTALEIFDYGKTLALLPLAGNSSSIVLTVKNSQVKEIIEMKNSDFNEFITNCFKSKLGKMTQKYERYSYPLISVHAKTFIAERFALIGDAAVGMHPVTAHGFNLGLRGQDILADLIKQAKINNQDIGSKHLLKTFEKKQIYFTKLMFFGTNGIVALFTNDKSFAKPIRKIVLKLAQRLPPIKKLITNQLTQTNKKRFSIF